MALDKLLKIKNTLPSHIKAVGLDENISAVRREIERKKNEEPQPQPQPQPSTDSVEDFFKPTN